MNLVRVVAASISSWTWLQWLGALICPRSPWPHWSWRPGKGCLRGQGGWESSPFCASLGSEIIRGFYEMFLSAQKPTRFTLALGDTPRIRAASRFVIFGSNPPLWYFEFSHAAASNFGISKFTFFVAAWKLMRCISGKNPWEKSPPFSAPAGAWSWQYIVHQSQLQRGRGRQG